MLKKCTGLSCRAYRLLCCCGAAYRLQDRRVTQGYFTVFVSRKIKVKLVYYSTRKSEFK